LTVSSTEVLFWFSSFSWSLLMTEFVLGQLVCHNSVSHSIEVSSLLKAATRHVGQFSWVNFCYGDCLLGDEFEFFPVFWLTACL
jgi:hypothetical protein